MSKFGHMNLPVHAGKFQNHYAQDVACFTIYFQKHMADVNHVFLNSEMGDSGTRK